MSNGPSERSDRTVACLGGAGGMGETLARHLCHSASVSRLIIADLDGESAARVAVGLSSIATCRVTSETVAPENVIDPGELLDALRPHCPGFPASVDELMPVAEMKLPR